MLVDSSIIKPSNECNFILGMPVKMSLMYLLTLGILGRFGWDHFWSTVSCTSTIILGSGPSVDSTPKASYWLQLCNHLGAACLGSFQGTPRVRS